MIKKTVDDAVMDAVLAKAFEEAAERDLAEMKPDPEAAGKYPEAFKKMERKRYNQARRRSGSSHNGCRGMSVMKRVVSFVLILGFVGCCLMLSAPKIRAEFSGMLTRFWEKCFSITIPVNVTTYETENFVFGYIPKSYEIANTLNNTSMSTYKFTSPQSHYMFEIKIIPGISVITQQDSDYTDVIDIHVNGYMGYLVYSQNDDKTKIIWTDNKNLFAVFGNISEAEMIKIAENIHVK